MIWYIELPAQITCGIFTGLLVLTLLITPKRHRMRAFVCWFVLAASLFIHSCIGIMNVLDRYRFGVFTYPDFQSVKDFRVERYLPEPAKDIVLDKERQGFHAKFKITKKDLDDWFDQHWRVHERLSVTKREPVGKPDSYDASFFQNNLGDHGWSLPPDALMYVGPRNRSYGGFKIWYSESQGTAYEFESYW